MQLCTSYMYIPYMTWFIRITAVTALHMCHNSFIWNCAPHICTYLISYDVFKCTRTHLTRLVHMCHDSRGVPYVYIQMHTPYMYIPYIIWRIQMYQDSFDTTRSHVPWLAGCPICIHSNAYPIYVHTLHHMTYLHAPGLIWHNSFTCAMTRGVSHIYTFNCVPHICTYLTWHDTFTCVMTPLYMCHDTSVCAKIKKQDEPPYDYQYRDLRNATQDVHSYVKCVMWRVHMCAMTMPRAWERHDSCVCVSWFMS